MITEATVEAVILNALANLNAERPADEQLVVGPETVLFGVDAEIDSLALISVIVDVESTLTAEHGLEIVLTDDRAVSQPESPFVNVGTLKRYIMTLAAEAAA